MEHMLQKMARQLNAYDEASLIALWDKYATIVERFEPTKRWEEAAIMFSLIQSVRLKNQLFNHYLAAGVAAAHSDTPIAGLDKTRAWVERHARKTESGAAGEKSEIRVSDGKPKQRSKVLRFGRRKGD